MIEDIIAATLVADGAPEAHAQSLALRIKSDLEDAGALAEMPEPYVPKPYPKWVHGQVVRSAAEETARLARFEPKAEPATPVVPAAPLEPAAPPAPAASVESAAPHEPPPVHEEPPHTGA